MPTINGKDYNSADFGGQNYAAIWDQFWADVVAHVANVYKTSSTTSLTIGTGARSLTVESGKPIGVGAPLRIASTAAPTNWMDAIVTSYDPATGALVVDVVGISGSGTYADWGVYLGGAGYALDSPVPVSQGGTGVSAIRWTSAAQVGSGTAITGAVGPRIAALSDTDIAIVDPGVGELRTYRFDGSTWAQVGTGLAIAGIGGSSIAALNGTDVAFIDNTLEELRTYSFDGSTWAQVGTGLAITGIGFPSIAALNAVDVALIDNTIGELRTYRFDGSTWAQVGTGLAIAGVSTPAVTTLNGTDLAFLDGGNEELRIYRFDGSVWGQIGAALSIPGIVLLDIAAINGTDVAYADSTNDEIRTYRFSFALGSGPYRPS